MGKRKTHEEFIALLRERNPTLECLGKYVDSNTKIEFLCKTCGHHFFTAPKGVTKRHPSGCPVCARKKTYATTRKTQEQFETDVARVNPNLEVLGKYVNCKTKVLVRCRVCGHEYKAWPSNITDKNANGCPNCYKISKRKTFDIFIQELKKINENIECIEGYVDTHTKAKFRCKICDKEWETVPTSISQGSGCPQCAIVQKAKNLISKTHKEFIRELSIVHPALECLEKWQGYAHPIKFRCSKCLCEFQMTPAHVMRDGCHCPECQRKNRESLFLQKIKKINPYIQILGEYINSSTKILCKCLHDGHEWYATPHRLTRGHGCPKCCMSHMERDIMIFLDRNNIEYIPQYKTTECFYIRPLAFDFYIPSYNVLVEAQGRQHYEADDFFGGAEEFAVRQKRDDIKRAYCSTQNIHLLEIPYWESKNIDSILSTYLSDHRPEGGVRNAS